MRVATFFYMMFCCGFALAIGDSPATTEGFGYFLGGLAILFAVCIAAVVYVCFKIVGIGQRKKWLLLGGLPSLACFVFFSRTAALAIAVGIALYLRHTGELKQRAKENSDDNINNNK
jgi:hypothetical protein